MSERRWLGTSFLDAGTSRKTMSLSGTLLSPLLNVASAANTNEQVAYTVMLPRNCLNGTQVDGTTIFGKWLNIIALAYCPNNNPTVRMRLRDGFVTTAVGGTWSASAISGTGSGAVLADTGAGAAGAVPVGFTGTGIFIEACWVRTGQTAADVFGFGLIGSTWATTTYTTSAQDGTPGITVTIQSTTGNANDIILREVSIDIYTEGGVQSTSGVLL